jgi:hypothetical protein
MATLYQVTNNGIIEASGTGGLIIESTVDLVINLQTAKALGISAPPSLLAQADQLIE